MWPKVLVQLFELLPHLARLVPMADKFFASRAATDRANDAAMAAMAEGVRGDLGQLTEAHSGLYRLLQEHSAQLAGMAEDAQQSRRMLEDYARRMEVLERQVQGIGRWVKAGVGLLIILLALVIWLILPVK